MDNHKRALPSSISETSLPAFWQVAGWERLVLAAAIGLMAIVCLSVVSQESITCDEIAHITAGMSYLQRGDARMNPEHPPLLKILAALPLVSTGAVASYQDVSWETQKEWGLGGASFRRWNIAGPHLVYLARMPMIALTVLLAATSFFMARALAGLSGGFLSLIIYASTPFFLAYGPLVLTDIGLALFALLTVWTFASLWQDPGPKRAAIFGLSLAGALLSKFSSGLLLPTLIALSTWFAIRLRSERPHVRRALRLSLLGVAFASATVYLSYLVLFWRTDTAGLLSYRYANSVHPKHVMKFVADLLMTHSWVDKALSPVALYFLGVGQVLHDLPRSTYLLGKIYANGTRAYFPVLFLYKMTPAFLCLVLLVLCLAAWTIIARRAAILDNPCVALHARALCVLLAVFSAAALLSPINVGIRHLSVPIAALTVLIGLVAPLASLGGVRTRRVVFAVVAFAVAGDIYSAASTFPNYISYFNGFSGKAPTYKIAVDSNLDWGQGLVKLREFMGEHRIESIALDTPGSIPEIYIAHNQEFRCEDGVPPTAEWLAVGATRFVERFDFTLDTKKRLGQCDYLFTYPQWAVAGGAVFVFRSKPAEARVKVESAPAGVAE